MWCFKLQTLFFTYFRSSTPKFDVVTTVKSIRHLIDGSIKNWHMRLQIKENNGNKLLLLDKPLPPQELTVMEKNVKAYKYILKLFTQKSSKNVEEIEKSKEEIPNNIEWKLYDFDKYLEQLDIPEVELMSQKNFTYSSLELSDSIDTMSLLIRTKEDGKILPDSEFVNISTKVEYCSEFGAQVMTQTELIRDWCRTKFRENSITKRVRIDSLTSIVLSQRTITLEKIEFDLKRLYDISSHQLLASLWDKISILRTFPFGDYFLMANDKNPEIINVHVALDKTQFAELSRRTTLFSIDTFLNSVSYDQKISENIVINAIDETEVTSLHRHTKITPCAFDWKHGNKKKIVDLKDKFNEKRRKIAQEKQEKEEFREIIRKANKKHKKNIKRKKRDSELKLKMEAEKLEQAKYEDDVDPYGEYINKDPNEVKNESSDCNVKLTKSNNGYCPDKQMKYNRQIVPQTSFFRFSESRRKSFSAPKSLQNEPLNKTDNSDLSQNSDENSVSTSMNLGTECSLVKPLDSEMNFSTQCLKPLISTFIPSSDPSYNPLLGLNFYNSRNFSEEDSVQTEIPQILHHELKSNDSSSMDVPQNPAIQFNSVSEELPALLPVTTNLPNLLSIYKSINADTPYRVSHHSSLPFADNTQSQSDSDTPQVNKNVNVKTYSRRRRSNSNLMTTTPTNSTTDNLKSSENEDFCRQIVSDVPKITSRDQTSTHDATVSTQNVSSSTQNDYVLSQNASSQNDPALSQNAPATSVSAPVVSSPSVPSSSAPKKRKPKSMISKLRKTFRVPNTNVKYI